MQFEETTYNFGTVKDGDKVKHVYKFKNTGKAPLIISDAKEAVDVQFLIGLRANCSGKNGEIKVEFDSKTKEQKKVVTNQKVYHHCQYWSCTNLPYHFRYRKERQSSKIIAVLKFIRSLYV